MSGIMACTNTNVNQNTQKWAQIHKTTETTDYFGNLQQNKLS